MLASGHHCVVAWHLYAWSSSSVFLWGNRRALSAHTVLPRADRSCVTWSVLCRDDTIFAVKAPAGTTLEVPEPEFQRMDDGKLAQRYRWVCLQCQEGRKDLMYALDCMILPTTHSAIVLLPSQALLVPASCGRAASRMVVMRLRSVCCLSHRIFSRDETDSALLWCS